MPQPKSLRRPKLTRHAPAPELPSSEMSYAGALLALDASPVGRVLLEAWEQEYIFSYSMPEKLGDGVSTAMLMSYRAGQADFIKQLLSRIRDEKKRLEKKDNEPS